MNKNSNTYIIAYAAVMVVIVAAVLSFAALSLKGVQAENARVEKMGDILRSIGEGGDADHGTKTRRPTSTSSIRNTSSTAMPSMSRATGSRERTRSPC